MERGVFVAARRPIWIGAAISLAWSLGAVSPAPVLAATTFTVNRTGDASDLNLANAKCDTSPNAGSQCTLRAAIEEANDTPGDDTIKFNITSGSSATKVIAPVSPLPPITDILTINGYTQTGASENSMAVGNDAKLRVALDGLNAGTDAVGLEIQASRSSVRGLVIMRWDGEGIRITGSGNAILGNFIGTNASGNAARPNGHGVTITGTNNALGSANPSDRNVISANALHGVFIFGPSSTGNVIAGNYIGTNKTGTAALGNALDGIDVNSASENTVGGTGSGSRNVVSGNGDDGIEMVGLSGPGPVNGLIAGNFVGTDASGTLDLGNFEFGIITSGTLITVGGTTAAARNVVSGNGAAGVRLVATESHVEGNYIGTDASGTAALGNGTNGVEVFFRDSFIGGSAGGAGNLISANGGHGVVLGLNGDSVHDNLVQGNRIGTKFDGTGDLGNGGNGVEILAGNNTIGGAGAASNLIAGNTGNGVRIASGFADGNTVLGNAIRNNDLQGVRVEFGPNTIGPGNVIFQNGDNGVRVSATAPGTRITANQVFGNGALGINLVGGSQDIFGVTGNDTDEPDTGANNLQNFPVLSSALRNGTTGVTTVVGALNSNPSTQLTIQVFLAVVDASGHGEGQVLLGSQNVTTNSGGDIGFVFSIAGLAPGHALTSTATSTIGGDTSEFSANLSVTPAP